ncbi:hypothetical protein D3C71_1844510 [compost metagenome]
MGSGVEEIARATFVLWLQFRTDQQSHAANIAEHVVLRVDLLEMLHKLLTLRVYAVQHFRGVDNIERRSGDRARQRVAAISGAVRANVEG